MQTRNLTTNANKVIDEADHIATDMVGQLSDMASSAADQLAATGRQLQAAQSRATQSCRSFVQKQPLTSLGIALAGGLVLGLALRSR